MLFSADNQLLINNVKRESNRGSRELFECCTLSNKNCTCVKMPFVLFEERLRSVVLPAGIPPLRFCGIKFCQKCLCIALTLQQQEPLSILHRLPRSRLITLVAELCFSTRDNITASNSTVVFAVDRRAVRGVVMSGTLPLRL